jgi:beta-glucosidase
MNTHRSPFGGRCFEYYSEDGFLAGITGGWDLQVVFQVAELFLIMHNKELSRFQFFRKWAVQIR